MSLCNQCRRIDFSLCERTAFKVTLGDLEGVRKQQATCSLCRLVIRTLCRRWNVHEARELPTGQWHLSDLSCWLLSASPTVTNSDENKDKIVSVIDIIVFQPPEGSQETLMWPNTDPCELLLLDQDADYQSQLSRNRVIDTKKVLEWLSDCASPSTSERSRLSHDERRAVPIAQGLLVIDVRGRCLASLPKDAEYFALSYCWGNASQFLTKTHNVESLKLGDSLRWLHDQLPRTIQDAITLTESLGANYLWIDALCIVQDDDLFKRAQIAQMHLVYGAAQLTIVAAAGDSADFGLPGVRSNTRYGSVSVQGYCLIARQLKEDRSMELSRWNTRGWTYQEWLLSERLLFVTEEEVYLQWGEGTRREHHTSQAIHFVDGGYDVTSEGYSSRPHRRTILNAKYMRNGDGFFHDYTRHVYVYTRRTLGQTSDILAAFEGITSIYTQLHGYVFWYGLPRTHLCAALLWRLEDATLRKKLVDHCKPCDLTKETPGWSWATLIGNVTAYNANKGTQALVYWYALGLDNTAVAVQDLKGPNWTRHDNVCTINHPLKQLEKKNSPEIAFLDADEERFQDWKSPWNPRYLLGITSKANFHVKDDQLYNSEDISVGRVWLDTTIEQRKTFDGTFTFILLSRSTAQYDVRANRNRLAKSTSQKRVLLDEYGRSLDRILRLVTIDIMPVEWHGDIAHRLGIAQIHEDAWAAASPKEVLVKLG